MTPTDNDRRKTHPHGGLRVKWGDVATGRSGDLYTSEASKRNPKTNIQRVAAEAEPQPLQRKTFPLDSEGHHPRRDTQP